MSIPFLSSSRPVRDTGHPNAFSPSPLSLRFFTDETTDFADADYAEPYRGQRWKILVVGSDQRYLRMQNATYFSTGNHPVETLVPMMHMANAGFGFDVATVSGGPVMFEHWAMPAKDEAVLDFYHSLRSDFDRPLVLSDVVRDRMGPDSDYIAVFIPGGHGALMGLPESEAMASILRWAAAHDKFVFSLCHGPAAFLSLGADNPFRGRKICAFSDFVDAQTPRIGYMPGKLSWKFGEKLEEQGFTIANNLVSGATCRDGRILTGDSPLASNALGKMAAKALLEAV